MTLENYQAIAESIALLLYPHAEKRIVSSACNCFRSPSPMRVVTFFQS